MGGMDVAPNCLDGVRVLDLSQFEAGPFRIKAMGDLPNFFRKPYEGGRAQMYDLTCAWRAFQPRHLKCSPYIRRFVIIRWSEIAISVPWVGPCRFPEFYARENVRRIINAASA